MTSLFGSLAMFISPIQNALLFSIKTIFNLYISIVLFRLILQLVRADFYNPTAQVVVKLTNPLLIPLRKLIPGFAGIDCAAIVLALTLQATESLLLLLITGFSIAPTILSISGLLIWSAGEVIDMLLVIFLFSTFLQVILSWIQPGHYNPNLAIFAQITEPLFQRVRRFSPNVGGLDFSPMIIIFFIILTRMLLAAPIIDLGKSLR